MASSLLSDKKATDGDVVAEKDLMAKNSDRRTNALLGLILRSILGAILRLMLRAIKN